MTKRMLLSICLILGSLGLVSAADWPQWRGPDRNDVSKEKGLLESWPPAGPKLLWIFRDAGAGHSSMSIVDDRLYSMGAEGDKDCVFAIDLKTQKKIWSTEVGDVWREGPGSAHFGRGPRSTPTIDGNYLYALGGFGNLVCMETASGKKVWSKDLVAEMKGVLPVYGYCESPLVDGDQVVVSPGGLGAIAAFDKKTGTLKWRTTTLTKPFKPQDIVSTYGKYVPTHASYVSMVALEVGGVRQYVQVVPVPANNGGLHELVAGVRASDGNELWRFPCQQSLSTPIFRSDCVYVSHQLLQIVPNDNKFKAERIYVNRQINTGFWGAVLVDGYIYGYTSTRSSFFCQDFKTGQIVWQERTRARGGANVTCADGNLYFYHENEGDVLLIKATSAGYQQQGKFRIPEETKLSREKARIYTRPIVANGKLYLRDQDLIFCFDIRKPR